MKKKKRPKNPTSLPVIGWREWVAFPDLNIRSIKAKIDTGARTSSLHAYDLRYDKQDALEYVHFKVHTHQRHTNDVVKIHLPVKEYRRVKSSTGHSSMRPVVSARVLVGENVWPIELTLADRCDMGFRLLLGRQSIRRRMIVDPGRSFLVSPRSGITDKGAGKK